MTDIIILTVHWCWLTMATSHWSPCKTESIIDEGNTTFREGTMSRVRAIYIPAPIDKACRAIDMPRRDVSTTLGVPVGTCDQYPTFRCPIPQSTFLSAKEALGKSLSPR